MDIDRINELVCELNTSYNLTKTSEERDREAVAEAHKTVEAVEEARAILQTIAEELQRRAHNRIAMVVSRCLSAVFDDPYSFHIRFERKRGKTEAVLEFRRDGEVFTDPLNEVGGGVLDVAALALRLACVMVSKPPARKVFILDEPWSNVRGEGNRERTRKMLEVLADEFEVQWIINTDIPAYRLGKVIEMGEGS